jgi:hypothetical protein
MTPQREAPRRPACGAAYDVLATWAPGGRPRGLSRSRRLPENARHVPPVRADQPKEVKT